MNLLVTNARLVPVNPALPDLGYLERGWLHVKDGRIEAIGEGDAPAVDGAKILDVDGSFVAPGFISSHSHLFTSGSRGLGVDQTLYGWCTSMFSLLRHASPEAIYWSTLHGSLDFLVNGVTTAFDFTDPRIPWEPMVAGERAKVGQLRDIAWQLSQIDGKADSGIRYLNATGLDDAQGTDEQIFDRLGEAVAHARGKDADRMLGAAIMGAVQWSSRPDAAELEVEAMRRFGITNQAHFLETREEVDVQRAKFDLYVRAGALGPDLVFGHFIQTTPQIIETAAAGGSGMSWQPASNGRLASGVADLPAIRAAGMTVGMGLDDQACTDIADPWQNMRMGMYMVRAQTGDPLSMMPEDVLELHTLGSARVLQVDDRVGSLEPGKFADFVVVDPRTPDIGPLWNPVRSYVLACGLRNLKQVYVGGVLQAQDGVSTSPLAEEASAKIHELLPAIDREHDIIR
ncbi:amidohydrolase family protein [Naasia sp. SYSU D00057]|uniref:amidohydrolase family protein n=1 Tax=Naasia sp. SYSU D00057 TaxID=2817380 RepID=UPI001B30E105|nr:amidohydrolase family protein [Naasia sp. SYSU D00057]